MDTLQSARRAVDQLGLRGHIDPARAEVVIPLTTEHRHTEESYEILLRVTATRVELRAPRLANTGGRQGQFDPALAALAATIAYDLDLHLGADTRDGEIEGRESVELAHVPERLRSEAIAWALRSFLHRQALARRWLANARGPGLATSVLTDPKLPASA